ncbi:peptidylprolyl isomerase [Phaeacidiphilus oryzae]|uniref:peptidylprolyl isomerase n=1 Tax=Phaeacidiphilus oryzae TaxID=348818 RepID=UPI00055B0F24|nr:peptidylprolyl isomerase [Phaeacidiphilus oryzae]
MASTEKRRRELARAKYLRQQQRRAEARRRAKRRTAVISGVAAVVVIAGVGVWAGVSGGSSSSASADTAGASASASASASPTSAHVAGCGTPAAGKPSGKQWKAEPAMSVDTSANYTATLNTNCGAITLKLDAAKAPHTVNSFVFLTKQHFFDHVKCHRMTTTGIYVLQCGDPTGTGTGGPGYKFKDENLTAFGKAGSSGSVTYPAGTVAMANSGADTNGSQFFLVYKDSPLPPSYTPFGTITGGLDTIKKVAAAGTNNANGSGDGSPLQQVVMNSVTTVKS